VVVILEVAEKRGCPCSRAMSNLSFPGSWAELAEPVLIGFPPGTIGQWLPVVRYRIDHTAVDGTRAEGSVWMSQDCVLMRFDGIVFRRGAAHQTAMRMEAGPAAARTARPAPL
jgi:hypothetical protein